MLFRSASLSSLFLSKTISLTVQRNGAAHATRSLPASIAARFGVSSSSLSPLSSSYSTSSTPSSSTPSSSTPSSSVKVTFPDGTQSSFLNIWLRDHCTCPDCLHEVTKQRLVDTYQIPKDLACVNTKSKGTEGVEIEWSHGGHKSFFTYDFLRKFSSEHNKVPQAPEYSKRKMKLWGAELLENLPVADFKDVVNTDEGLRQALNNISTYGLTFIDNVPITNEDTKKVAERISIIRDTHYGGWWEFSADLKHADTAYTSLALGAHTDGTYFSEAPGLQLLHLVKFIGEGGKSLFVDGFYVANELKKKHSDAFEILSRISIPSHYYDQEKKIFLEPITFRPIINLDKDTKEVVQIRFNNDDRAPIRLKSVEESAAFYHALRCWNDILRCKDTEMWTQLFPGRLVIFDNWRSLHGRSSYTGVIRLISGCYLQHDDYRSRLLAH